MAPVMSFMCYKVSNERDQSFFKTYYFSILAPAAMYKFLDRFPTLFIRLSQCFFLIGSFFIQGCIFFKNIFGCYLHPSHSHVMSMNQLLVNCSSPTGAKGLLHALVTYIINKKQVYFIIG